MLAFYVYHVALKRLNKYQVQGYLFETPLYIISYAPVSPCTHHVMVFMFPFPLYIVEQACF